MADKRWTAEEKRRLETLWDTDGVEAIAKALGRTCEAIRQMAYKLCLNIREPVRERGDPTIREIAERSARIRAGWSEDERHRRLCGDTEHRQDDCIDDAE